MPAALGELAAGIGNAVLRLGMPPEYEIHVLGFRVVHEGAR
jgi:hypothetical protein